MFCNCQSRTACFQFLFRTAKNLKSKGCIICDARSSRQYSSISLDKHKSEASIVTCVLWPSIRNSTGFMTLCSLIAWMNSVSSQLQNSVESIQPLSERPRTASSNPSNRLYVNLWPGNTSIGGMKCAAALHAAITVICVLSEFPNWYMTGAPLTPITRLPLRHKLSSAL